MPSLAMIGTITSPAPGSAHHQPNKVFRSNALMAPLPIPAATRRFALANNGMTITAAAATMIPGMLRSGASWPISVEPDS